MRILGFIFIATMLMIGCKNQNKKSKTETLEIYDTVGDESNMQAGSLKYFESSEYLDGKKISTTYYDASGNSKGKEMFSYLPNDTIKIGAQYFDNTNKLLSYYKYIIDNKGRLIASYAFDASNDDLLRVEQYYYLKNKMMSKRIFDSQLNADRRYAFTYDEFGNETGFQVYNKSDSLVVKEEFKITKKGSDNKWLEKWGFANGKPVTFHKKK